MNTNIKAFFTNPGSPVRPEDLRQSQYFDALETIREEEAEEADQPDNASVVSDQPACPGNDADTSADDWTDLSDVEEIEEPKQKQMRKPEKPVYPEPVRRRIRSLKRAQFETEKLEAKFYRQLFYLESEFNLKKKEPILDRRFEIVNHVDGHGGTVGVEDFWWDLVAPGLFHDYKFPYFAFSLQKL